jgi:hypothetical protein
MRALVTAVLMLLLSGCWMGDRLYSAADARPALPPGSYRIVGGEGESAIARVSIMANGMTRIQGPHDEAIFGFVPLDGEGRAFVQWDDDSERAPGADVSQVYYLVEHGPGDEYVFYFPMCENEEREIALAAGAAVVTEPNVTICRFSTRASLEGALRRLRPNPEQIVLRLTRIGAGDQ